MRQSLIELQNNVTLGQNQIIKKTFQSNCTIVIIEALHVVTKTSKILSAI